MEGITFQRKPLALAVALVAGCAAHGEHETGSLRCAGLCELVIEKRDITVVTQEHDGSIVTTKEDSASGVIGDE